MARTIAAIILANKSAGLHFFDPGSLRFFNSRILSGVYEGPGGVYFVTSERDRDYRRRFTVRKFNPETGNVDTFGDFYRIGTAREAKALAKRASQVGC